MFSRTIPVVFLDDLAYEVRSMTAHSALVQQASLLPRAFAYRTKKEGRNIRPPEISLSDLGQCSDRLLQIFVRRNVIAHLAIVVLLVCYHIEITCSGQAEYDVLLFSGLLAL